VIALGAGRPWSVAAAALALSACSAGAVSYTPLARPQRAVSGLSASVGEIVIDHGELRVLVDVDVDPVAGSIALTAVRLGPPGDAPCGERGIDAARLRVGGREVTEPSITVTSRRLVEAVFPLGNLGGPGPLQQPMTIGVGFVTRMGEHRCLAVDVTDASGSPGWRMARHTSIAWDLWLLPPFAVLASYGTWRGPVRFGLGPGAASLSCRCPEGMGTLQLPVSVSAEAYAGRGGTVMFGIKLAYDLVPVVGVGAADSALRHGGRVELKFGVATGTGRVGFPSDLSNGAWTLSGIAAHWPSIRGESPMQFVGLAVGWMFPH
jgi:hypothetical protein